MTNPITLPPRSFINQTINTCLLPIRAIINLVIRIINSIASQLNIHNSLAFKPKSTITEIKPEQSEKSKSYNWKKVLIIGSVILGISLLAWSRFYLTRKISTETPLQTLPTCNDCSPIPKTPFPFFNRSIEAIEEKIAELFAEYEAKEQSPPIEALTKLVAEFYEAQDQCPSIEALAEHQNKHGYFGWKVDSLKRLFGNRRLGMTEVRDFYHDILKKIPLLLGCANGDLKKCALSQLDAKKASSIRVETRSYAREISSFWSRLFLYFFEPREKEFEFYWEKYNGDIIKIIDGAMRSNGSYDAIANFFKNSHLNFVNKIL